MLLSTVLTHVIDPSKAPLTLAKLKDPFKNTIETAQKDLKPIYSGLNKYGKALDKVGCSMHDLSSQC